MPSAQREKVRDFAIAEIDVRMDIARQIARRRKAVGFTQAQLAVSARVTEVSLALVEQGIAFEGSHLVACAVIDAVQRLETMRAGKAHLQLV